MLPITEAFLTLNSGTSTPISQMNNGSVKAKGIVVFSGGSAANNLVDVFKTVREDKRCPLSYVIPISDNGGSSSELIRVFGGPGIGDVRSRLVRLIPDDPDNDESEKAAIKAFFNHRLPKERTQARQEWLQIVEAEHALWTNISTPKKELIRSILNLVAFEIVKRRRPSSSFDFSGASIGNLFLTGARLFTGSFESAIYLLSSICSVPSHTSVLPAINTNFTHHISVGLANGDVITGQNSISHPSLSTALESGGAPSEIDETEHHDRIEDANLPGSLPTLRKQYITFSKADEEELRARIERLWYINPYGQEIRIAANPMVLHALAQAQAVIYSIGSLYTSIVPSLVLKGVGEAINNPAIRYKILILNSTIDRETGPSSKPYSAMDFIAAIAKACEDSKGMFGPTDKSKYKNYVTHLIHLQGPGTPAVDMDELRSVGIEAIRVYGRKNDGENFVRYDERGLIQALEVTMGKRDPRMPSRRNTLEGQVR
ncbi:Nn.00g104980.m01.CDS01 [Neocucurbitaria sp. VM-36]